MAEKQRSRRDQVVERLKTKHPEREYADDEALFGQIDDDYAASEEELGRYKERDSQMTDLFSRDPRSAQFITDMARGEDPWIAVIKRMGIDGITDLMNDPAKQEAYAEANKEYVERLAKEKDLEQQYEANFAESMKMLEQMQAERGLGDETIDAAMDLIMRMVNEAIVGKFTPETVEMALKAVNHDSDMDNARSEGELAGRNQQVEEKLRKARGGDGMPDLGGRNNTPRREPDGGGSLFDLARSAQ